MKETVLILVGVLIGGFLGINYQKHTVVLKQKSREIEMVEIEKVFDEILERNEATRKIREEFIEAMTDADFNDPNNHLPRWMVKLEVYQQYDLP